MNTEDKVKAICDKAYAFIVGELAKDGIKADSQSSDDCIWFDDTEQKKTFCINLAVNECDEYEGE